MKRQRIKKVLSALMVCVMALCLGSGTSGPRPGFLHLTSGRERIKSEMLAFNAILDERMARRRARSVRMIVKVCS